MFYFLSIFIFLASLSAPAFGQADYRNLDPGRPITIEDAQPIEFRAFEFSFGSRYGRHQEGYELSFEPELKWGFAKNWQVGVSGERAVLDDGQRTDVLAGTEFHFLYNLNQEDFDLPAIAFRPEFDLRRRRFGNRPSARRSQSDCQQNVRIQPGSPQRFLYDRPHGDLGEGGDLVNRYLYGIAYERTAPIEFFVLLFDLYAAAPIDGGRREIIYDLGTRIQMTPTWVFDAGFFHAIRSEDLDFGVTVGFSYVFSPRSIFPKGL